MKYIVYLKSDKVECLWLLNKKKLAVFVNSDVDRLSMYDITFSIIK